jgi:putative transposase
MAFVAEGGFKMARKRHKPEEIVAKLWQVDVLTSQVRPVAEAVLPIGVTEVTYYRWRQEYGGLKSGQVTRLKELETENASAQGGVGSDAGEADPERGRFGKPVSPARRRVCVERVMETFGVSRRFACRILGQHRSTQRKIAKTPDDEAALTADIHRARHPVWPLWMPPHHGAITKCRLGPVYAAEQ